MDSEILENRRALRKLIGGYQLTQVLNAVGVLGIPDLLGDGRRGADDLAHATRANPLALYRLLRAAAAVGILDEDGSKSFALTPLGDGMRTDAPGSMAAWVEMLCRPNPWQNWGQLADSVRTGETGWKLRLGLDAWTYRLQHPDEAMVFDRAMVSVSGVEAEAVSSAYDFSRFRTIVDVGGGRGTLLAEILRRNPGSTGVLFDQPHVVKTAEPLLQQAGVADRCRIEAGSFFEVVPGGGDAYILKSVIHDWYDPEARRILETCRKFTVDGTVLLLVERRLDPPNQGQETKLSDLNMLTGPGGMERTAEEYAELLRSAGFRLQKMVPTKGAFSLLEAFPA